MPLVSRLELPTLTKSLDQLPTLWGLLLLSQTLLCGNVSSVSFYFFLPDTN